ncbi:MAG: recombinase family protein [Salibacteraceae bacterium]
MAVVGYRRVSTIDQKLDRQDLGATDKIFEEKLSGKSANDRPALQALIEYVREGDKVVVYSIDRLARDVRDLQDIVNIVTDRGASISFLSENRIFSAEKDDAFAKLQVQMMGAFAEFERNIIRKRQAEGIEKAKAKGLYKGRKPMIDRERVKSLREAGLSTYKIADKMQISRMSVHRILND